ncbi:MAG: hypothetical protein HY791_07070 [Deltaproteobacteria bacterium]|nr:hypothetical protein [Deltaproteobacteria bacterium]
MSHAVIAKPTDISVPATSLWAKMPMLGGILAVVGLGATLAAGSSHEGRGFFSYLWAFEVCLSIMLGGLGWVLIDHAVRSQWSPVVRRIGETAAATAPVFIVLFIPIALMGFHSLYPWTHEQDEILAKKRWFLTPGFFFGRAALYLLIWTVLGMTVHRLSTKQDSLGNDPAARDKVSRSLWTVGAAGIALWALSLSFAAIDWLMSLQPHWYSTIFGVYLFAASILAFFAFMTLVAMSLQKAGLLKHAITIEHYHDLGKFVFGFTVFWAYIAFSQFVLIWYANLPEETEFYMVRLEGGWEYVSYALPFLHFFIPFLYLISRHVKRNTTLLAIGCVWTLVMHALDIYWLVLPNHGAHGGASHFAPSWTDATAMVGMVGMFLAFFGFLLKKNAVVCINDPRLEESLAHENY